MGAAARSPLRVPGELVREIVGRADCDDVARLFPAKLTPARRPARRYYCPWCQDGPKRGVEAKLSTNAHNGRGWACFKKQSAECERGGDALSLAAKLNGWNLRNAADYLDAVEWLAELVGYGVEDVRKVRAARESLRPASTATRASSSSAAKRAPPPAPVALPRTESPAGPPPPPLDVGALWSACQERADTAAAIEWLQRRGFPLDIHRRAESGFALLDAPLASAIRGRVADDWLDAHTGAALVAPLRSARTNTVEALDLRAFRPRDEQDKRRSVGALPSTFAPVMTDEDGTPRGYGFAGAATRASLLVLVEGMADTLAGEAFLRDDAGAVVVGAHSASQIPAWARYLAQSEQRPGRVVVVRHLDKLSQGASGAGQKKAGEAVEILTQARARAVPFKWGPFLRELVESPQGIGDGFDLADALRLACSQGRSFDDVRAAFRRACGVTK